MTVITNLKDYDTLDELLDRKRYWMQLACLWRHVENTLGIEVRQQVCGFGFDSSYLKPEEKLATPTQFTHHNYVRLKDNTVLEMPLFPRPIPADSMSVSFEEKLV
jgi:hypothetical protein